MKPNFLFLGLALVAGVTATSIALAAKAPAAPTSVPKGQTKWEIIGPAPNFSLKSAVDGKNVQLTDFKGKVRVVDFWATWCPPCRKEIPGFISLQTKYQPKGLEVIGVSVDRGGTTVVNEFAKANGINYTSLMSATETEAAYGGIRGIPTTFVIDRDGNIVKKFVGDHPVEEFDKVIQQLL